MVMNKSVWNNVLIMWKEMADKGYIYKDEYFRAYPKLKVPQYSCFFCEEVDEEYGTGVRCSEINCDIYACIETPFSDWTSVVTKRECKKHATRFYKWLLDRYEELFGEAWGGV